jgi:hypothetical protein
MPGQQWLSGLRVLLRKGVNPVLSKDDKTHKKVPFVGKL